ncbi:RNA polymerase sigma-70 factor [Cytophaga sp. FL35]|uniref:RNA polymerase sigma factor n=1 Tax=Cytophaga sp. FL35 TaxID=1904456 RepID=UPI001653790B|nr:RNA polymerase sigma-70 factor [Cytophaga sp. FL35]MBC6999428.1 RNA polymerase sigma-70 factor [Cytophaga sp. FL35]
MSVQVEPNIVEIQKRNHLAFKRLFDSLYGELVIYAQNYLYDEDLSKDLVQEAFVKIWEKADRLQIQTNLRAYMYAMVRNKCLNHLKKYKISDNAKFLEEQAVLEFQDLDEDIEFDELQLLHHKVLEVMDSLPHKMRTIVELRFKASYRYQEIADELNLSVNTVKTQLQRAKAKFSELILFLLFLFINV